MSTPMRVLLLALALVVVPALAGCLEGDERLPADGATGAPREPTAQGPAPAQEDEPPAFAPPHDPPTQDPVEPYEFDPTLPVQLSRNASGVLSRDCGSKLQNGSYERFCPEQRAPPGCEPDQASYPTGHADADGNRIFDDFERHMDRALADGGRDRVQALVDFVCPITWAFVLDLREDTGHFPVNTVWSTGFSADLAPEQVRALAAHDDTRAVEGVRYASGA